jgi:hypothetical protein
MHFTFSIKIPNQVGNDDSVEFTLTIIRDLQSRLNELWISNPLQSIINPDPTISNLFYRILIIN